jgi:hypothetical protein
MPLFAPLAVATLVIAVQHIEVAPRFDPVPMGVYSAPMTTYSSPSLDTYTSPQLDVPQALQAEPAEAASPPDAAKACQQVVQNGQYVWDCSR